MKVRLNTILIIIMIVILIKGSLLADDNILKYPYRQTFRNPFVWQNKNNESEIKKAVIPSQKETLKINLPFKIQAIVGNDRRRIVVVKNSQGDYSMVQSGDQIEDFTIKKIYSKNIVISYKEKIFNVIPGSDIGEIIK